MPLFELPNVEKLKAKGDIKGLIEALGYTKDESVRKVAAEALGEIGDAQAVGPLIAVLNEGSIVREVVVEALGKIGDPQAVDPIIAALKDNDEHVRKVAAVALIKIGDPRAMGPLAVALRSEGWDVRGSAAEALAKVGDPQIIKPLIAALMDENGQVNGRKILAYQPQYLRRDDYELVAWLIEKGADVNAMNSSTGQNVLHMAVIANAYDCARVLIERSAGVDTKQRDVGLFTRKMMSTALHDVAATGTARMADLLIKAGADVNAKTEGGYTPLLIAAGRGRTEVVQVLLGAGANIYVRGKSGLSAAYLAEERGYVETAELLRKIEKENQHAHAEDFVDNNDETITDQRTGLMWQQAEDSTERKYEEALIYCQSLELAGHQDWRLPYSGELERLAGVGFEGLSQLFPKIKAKCYWAYTVDTLTVIAVNFDPSSEVYGKYSFYQNPYRFYVRAVRQTR